MGGEKQVSAAISTRCATDAPMNASTKDYSARYFWDLSDSEEAARDACTGCFPNHMP